MNTSSATYPLIIRLVALRQGDPTPVFSDDIPTLIINDEGKGKKYALSKGMRQITSPYVWLTDADIQHLQISLPSTIDADLLIAPLFMRPSCENQQPSLLDRLQIIEYAAIQALTMQTALKGKPVMCAGANLIVRRDAWLACEADLHPEIPSGDDMFLLESMKKKGFKVAWAQFDHAFCTAAPSLKSLLRQRMRWAGKAAAYTDTDIIRCGFRTILSNLLVLLCPIWAICKWLFDWQLVLQTAHLYQQQLNARYALDALLLTLIYPYYMLLSLLGGLLHTFRSYISSTSPRNF